MRLGIENPPRKIGLAGLVLLTALSLLAASACGGEDGAQGETSAGKVPVVTTLPLFADFVRQVGGERVNVAALYSAGIDPHTSELSPRNVNRLTRAALVVANGLGLEGPALRVIEPNLPSGTPLLLLAEEALASGFSPAKPLGAAAVDNPHLWLDIDAAKAYAKLIADALAGVDPAGASAYDFNYRRFLLELDNLLQYVRDKVEKVPPQQRKLVTTHEAFPYLAAYLGLEQVAVLTPAPGQEPSPADLNRLKETLRREAIAAVFTEPQLAAGSSLLKEAAKETGARVCTLYSDSLDSKVRGYVELMRHNADEIARCLGEANG